jgi:hypothetical protein
LLAVTSFHPSSFSQYAQRCLQGLGQHFPGRVVAFIEQPCEAVEGVEYRDFFKIPDFIPWLERVRRHPGSDGKGPESYDFRYDAQKFCRKVFAQDAAFDEDRYVFWIDADSIIKQDIPEDFLKGLFNGSCLCYLGRKNSYTESGFLGFDTLHPDFLKFRKAYYDYVFKGKIFSQLKGWHDCIAFDFARDGISGNNLSPKGQNYDAVMEGSVLDPYITHLKGHRKFDESLAPKVKWA